MRIGRLVEILAGRNMSRSSQNSVVQGHLQVMASPAQQERVDAWLAFLDVAGDISMARVLYLAWIKRWFDIVGSFMLLALLSPLLALIMAAIRLEAGGDTIFRQERVGRDGKLFPVYKFRTMIPDRRNDGMSYLGDDRRRSHKTPRDPRVTNVGAFLRRTSLDELPQIVNVLKGEMSFIGPRPELPSIVVNYEPWQHERHLVRPGLSGWWQVVGRSDLPMHQNTELDIYYVRNCSLQMDLKIFVRTFGALLKGRGAF
jgi:lipopolysaccharide/colanic/teichoic acid biosynthesis glycosyltransferase